MTGALKTVEWQLPKRTIGRIRFATIGAFVMIFALSLTRGVAQAFVYDAHMYWAGAYALVSGGDATTEGGLDLRGVLSSLIYIPAAMFGKEAATVSVLVENATLIALIGSLLLPQLLGKMVSLRAWQIWVSSALTVLLLSGFAPYPLMDLWAIAFLLLGVLLLSSHRKLVILAAGFSFAVTLDLRPAFLVPVAFLALVWIFRNWRIALYPMLGGAIGFLPQIIFNHQVFRVWSLFAPNTLAIAGIQAASASFLVRYDTVLFVSGVDPRQSYCSPGMSAIVAGSPPTSTSELLVTFVQHPVESLLLAAQKISATISWEWVTPYSRGPQDWIGFFALLTLGIATLGLVGLVYYAIRSRGSLIALELLAIWLGTAATIVVSSPEARFGLPLLLIGVLGCLTVNAPSLRSTSSVWSRYGLAITSIALIALVVVSAATGLANPAPPGPSTATLCDTNQ